MCDHEKKKKSVLRKKQRGYILIYSSVAERKRKGGKLIQVNLNMPAKSVIFTKFALCLLLNYHFDPIA